MQAPFHPSPCLGTPFAPWHERGAQGHSPLDTTSGLRKPMRWLALLFTLGACLLATPSSRAELQFDVFVGLDDRVREGHWFPIAFEILNDGPPFTGTVIVGTETAFDNQQRQFAIELPTGTRKRVVLPVFPTSGRFSRWEAKLLDPDGKIIAEKGGIQPKDLATHIPLLGALPRAFGGLPTLPEVPNRGPDYLPSVARLQSEYLPSNPIALEGLTALYLNSEKASELKAEQVDALLAWLFAGGHLVLAIEQPNDVTALPWLRGLLPFIPETITNRPNAQAFERWVAQGPSPVRLPSAARFVPGRPPFPVNASARSRSNQGAPTPANVPAPVDIDPFKTAPTQPEFANADIPILLGRKIEGETLLSLGDAPAIISAPRGRGLITILTFSPERDPFRSWKARSWFWARLIGIPAELLRETDAIRAGGTSIDGIFGAMLDSRQIRKLPIGALLLLLVVYLGVIGPLDQWVLKRLGKQMWTWVTFPCYVVLFSGLIYFIGYRLRAGELELNELQVVDQMPRNQGALLRGRTWMSIYSPGNAQYRMASELPFATFRAELQQGGQGRGDAGRMTLRQPGKGFDADIFVPVWVSQLYSSDWLDLSDPVVTGTLESEGGTPILKLKNESDLRFTAMTAVYKDRVYTLGELPPQGTLNSALLTDGGRMLEDFMAILPGIHNTVQQRRFAFGGEQSGRVERNLDGVMLASFVDRLRERPTEFGEYFASHSGFDLTRVIQRGDVVIFGWAPGQGIAAPIHRFTPARSQRDLVVRVNLPAPSTPSP